MKINKQKRRRKAKRRPLAACFNSCVWCVPLDAQMLMGIRQTGSGSAFRYRRYFPDSLNKYDSFFYFIHFLFFFFFFFYFQFFEIALFKERKGERGRCIQGQCKCLLPRKWGKQSECKQTEYSCHTLTWGDAHQHMWAGRRKKTVAVKKTKLRRATCRRLMHKHTRGLPHRQDVQFNQIPSANKQAHRRGGVFHLSFVHPIIPVSADLRSFILVLEKNQQPNHATTTR